MKLNTKEKQFVRAGAVIGIGMGGFVDGILFHQLLQLHNMLSARYPVRDVDVQTQVVNLEINMFWDGLFHAFTWLTTAAGIALLWRALQAGGATWPTKTLVGSLLFGWGLFNLVEGIVNHHILHLHHVTEGPRHLIWDLLFLASGAGFIVYGRHLIRESLRISTAP